ncbi:MAG: DUF2384 domain-containing protein [Deltaproteobacteria bacterium]|nr:DUF2384 domain-containing protein [Deltaproteobacteria bacterium]MBW2100386.1 DUF2384 domain-containing protein [Deltaproteobacteria bacterium]
MQVDSINIRSDNLFEMIGMVKKGLPVDAFYRLRKKLGLSEKALAEVIHISKRTLTRRKQDGRLSSAESERVLRLARLFDKAVNVFAGREDIAAKWFKEPARGLGSQTPLAFSETELGAQQVHTLLVRIEHGVFPG